MYTRFVEHQLKAVKGLTRDMDKKSLAFLAQETIPVVRYLFAFLHVVSFFILKLAKLFGH